MAEAVFVGWETFAILAALISVFASVLLLMFSKIFQFPQFQQVAKVEIVYAASTVFLVLVIIGVVKGGENMLVGIASEMFSASYGVPLPGTLVTAGGQDATLIDITKLYMEPAITCSRKIINMLYAISIPSEAIASVYLEIFMSEHASGFGFKILVERINNATQALQFFVLSYYVIVHILNFINHYALFFVGVGVVLRAFPPTRGAGAYIIAFAIGMYLVFPMTYILATSMTLPYVKPAIIDNDNNIAAISYAPGRGFSSNVVCTLPELGDMQYCGFTTGGKMFEIKSWMSLHRSKIKDFLGIDPTSPLNISNDSSLTSVLRHITITICFVPLVAMVLVLTFVLSTSNLFGGNIPEIGRGLVKFL